MVERQTFCGCCKPNADWRGRRIHESRDRRASPTDIATLARTLYGEARGEAWAGKVAVAWVIRNRAERGGWWGGTIDGVCRKPWQFSCWNANDPNRAKLQAVTPESPAFADCLAAAAAVLGGLVKDPTRGACHYHAPGVRPAWAAGKDPVATIGRHRFYRGIE